MSINHLQMQQTAQPIQPQQYYQPQMPTVPQTQQANNTRSMTWVQGLEGAKAYLLAPGITMPLWDSENQCIYIKASDQNGIPRPLTILDYTIRQPEPETNPQQIDTSQFVSKEEFSELRDMISDLKDSLAAQQARPNNYSRKGGNRNEK